MIFTERTITIRNGESRINEPIILYRGDYEVEVRFKIVNSKFEFVGNSNVIESENAAYGQLILLAPDGTNIVSSKVKCFEDHVAFVISDVMIDEIDEVGLYSFQIRLFDYAEQSRATIPPVEYGIEIREPIASEDHTNVVNEALTGYSIAKVTALDEESIGETFDQNGLYNVTNWETGDRITEEKLNKIEEAIDTINTNMLNEIANINNQIAVNSNITNTKLELLDDRLILNVKDFGAIGDGVTDDTIAFRNAIDNIDARGMILIPKGVYIVENILIDKDRVTFKGESRSVAIKTYGDEYGIKVTGDSCMLENFDLLAQDNNGVFPTSHGILLTSEDGNAYGTKINNISISYFNGDGIRCEAANDGYMYLIGIHRVEIFNVEGNGIVLKAHDSEVSSCDIHDTGLAGIVSTGGNSRLSNMKVYYCSSNDRNSAGVVITGRRNLLSNIDAQENYGNGFIFDTTSTGSVGSSLLADANGMENKDHTVASNDKKVGYIIKADNISIQGNAIDFRGNCQKKAFEIDKNIVNLNLDILQDDSMDEVVPEFNNDSVKSIHAVLPRGCGSVGTPMLNDVDNEMGTFSPMEPEYIVESEMNADGYVTYTMPVLALLNAWEETAENPSRSVVFSYDFDETFNNGYSVMVKSKMLQDKEDSYRELFGLSDNTLPDPMCGVSVYNRKPILYFTKEDGTRSNVMYDGEKTLDYSTYYTYILSHRNHKTTLHIYDDKELFCTLTMDDTFDGCPINVTINREKSGQSQYVNSLSINDYYNMNDISTYRGDVLITDKTKLYFCFEGYMYPKCCDLIYASGYAYKLYIDEFKELKYIQV